MPCVKIMFWTYSSKNILYIPTLPSLPPFHPSHHVTSLLSIFIYLFTVYVYLEWISYYNKLLATISMSLISCWIHFFLPSHYYPPINSSLQLLLCLYIYTSTPRLGFARGWEVTETIFFYLIGLFFHCICLLRELLNRFRRFYINVTKKTTYKVNGINPSFYSFVKFM